MSWCHIYYIISILPYIYSEYVTASEYYVSAAPNGESCPSTDLPCHNLSYYIADYAFYFTDNSIFYFLNGTHSLQVTLEINNVSNITLKGLGYLQQGFNEAVMQSTSVIMCSDKKRVGIQINSCSDVVLKLLTITNCGFNWHPDYSVSLYLVNINNIRLEYVSVQNSSGHGLFLLNVYDVIIANSSFANNRGRKTFVGNVYIIYNDQINRLSRFIILKSNFTMGLGYGIYLKCGNDTDVDINIENCIFSSNIAPYGGGVYIRLHGDSSIRIRNCIIYNNTARYGGGMYIRTYWNSSIELSNCNIYNNIAELNGGGVRLYSIEGDTFEFSNCTIYDNTAQSHGGGMYISLYGKCSTNMFSNSTISNNTAYIASGLYLRSLRSTSNLTRTFHFTKVLFHLNKVFNRPDAQQKRYQSAITLLNVDSLIFDQIAVSNHKTTGLVGDNSLITFKKNSIFVNNSGIYGGGIALYDSSQIILNQNTIILFLNNYASKSGGGIFVSQFLGVDNTTDCSFKVIPYHDPNDTKTVLYFVNNTADISGDVLYGGKIDDCTSTLYFDHLFHYPQQTGLSVVTSDPIQVCFCESNRPNCSITNVSIFVIPGFDVGLSLATVGILDGLTEGVIKLTSSDNSIIVQYNNDRLNAIFTNVYFTLRINSSLYTTQVYATLNSSIIEPLYDPYTKVIEVTIEPCPNGFLLANGICVCRPQLNSGSITVVTINIHFELLFLLGLFLLNFL